MVKRKRGRPRKTEVEKKEVSTQINIFLGLLTPNERIGIITKKIYS
jgi:hypothetical protein